MEDDDEVADERQGILSGSSSQNGSSSRWASEPEQLTACGASVCCDPRRNCHRFVVLIFMCFLCFGSFFCYDNPGALQTNIKNDMKVNAKDYMGLYAWYSWPNVILCFFGGFLLDRVFGIRVGTIIFAVFVLIGQVIFASGALCNKFWLMEVGRFVFGIGGESLAVAQNTYAVSWFKGNVLNMVFGLLLSFARVGSTVNFNVMQPIYDVVSQSYTGYTCLGIVLMIATSTCALSLICAVILAYFDYRAEVILHRKAGERGEVVRLQDAKNFSLSFWMVAAICVCYYVAVFPFISLGVVFFERKFDLVPSEAKLVNSLVYVVSAVASPFLGLLVDKTGRNIFWVFLSIIFTMGSHGMLAFTFINPYISMIAMGISYSLLASALWPMVALVIPEYQLGTAYGVMQSAQNLGLAALSIVAGLIVDNNGYLILEIFFLAWLCVALIATIILWMTDAFRGGHLNLSVNQRSRLEKELLIAETVERERLVSSGSMPDVASHDLLQPRSDFHIRNRYLSRIGLPLPTHYDVTVSALMHRTGLK